MSRDAEKVIGKIEHPFLIKTLSKREIEGNSFNLMKRIYEKPNTNITLHNERLNVYPKNRNQTGMSAHWSCSTLCWRSLPM